MCHILISILMLFFAFPDAFEKLLFIWELILRKQKSATLVLHLRNIRRQKAKNLIQEVF